MQTPTPDARLHGLPPVFDARARVLILGSFPSVASLGAGQYYAHPRNQFWPILATLLQQPLLDMSYDKRLAAVRAAGIAIWDVFASCERPGSLDSAIRQPEFNDIAGLCAQAPGLQRICFNGGLAGKQARLVLRQSELAGLTTCILPSTSPAHAARGLSDKLLLWHEGLALPTCAIA